MSLYIRNLGAILRKAQGVVDAETNQPIDIGGEVLAIRQEGDALNARITELEKECAVLREDSESCTNEMCRQADLKDDALARIAELEALLGEAPHGPYCEGRPRLGIKCNCFKSRA